MEYNSGWVGSQWTGSVWIWIWKASFAYEKSEVVVGGQERAKVEWVACMHGEYETAIYYHWEARCQSKQGEPAERWWECGRDVERTREMVRHSGTRQTRQVVQLRRKLENGSCAS